ncbi:hypothetical protein ACSBR2_027007 [Camellia fascicularis]
MEMTLFSVLSLSLLISLFLPSHSLSEPEHCNSEDKKVLIEIKATQPEYLASWNPSIDCCDWAGVECDETTSRVIALAIFGGNFSGQIPSVVSNLKYLESLVFRKLPNLTGKIPFAITKLMHLKEIRLSWTNLFGPVPSFFCSAKKPNLPRLGLQQPHQFDPSQASPTHQPRRHSLRQEQAHRNHPRILRCIQSQTEPEEKKDKLGY